MTKDNVDPKIDGALSSERPSERPSEPPNDRETPEFAHAPSGSRAPKDIKESKAAQFRYGRQSQHATEHFDRTSRRLERGNPDVGQVDLGNIEADTPAEPDDQDHYD
ncbi:MAG: hypothetical protein NDI61_12005 [Bdellovibrionaceae bacterium]|nr:hypothetical protein [Pseudobdellovibrionaceae bacterium]